MGRPDRRARKAVPRRLPSGADTRATSAQLREEISQLREALEVETLVLEAEHESLTEAQRQLEASRDRYADLFDFAPIGFAILNRGGIIANLNITGASLLGWERTRLLGKPLLPLLAKADRHKFMDYLARVRMAEPSELKAELLFRKGRHEEVRLEFTSLVARDALDGGLHIRTAFRDVTDQWRAEQTARDARAQLPLVADIAPVLLTRCSRDLYYVFVNQACADFLGLPRSEIVGRPITEVIGAEAFETIRPYVQRVLEGRPVEFETEMTYARQPGPRFMRVAYRPEMNDEGAVVGWVAAITDITDRKHAEAALQEAHDRLEERIRERTAELQKLNTALEDEIRAHKAAEMSRSQLAAIVESSADAILSVGLDENITSWNRGAEGLYGYPASEIIGRPLSLLMPPDQRTEFLRRSEVIQQGKFLEPFDTILLKKGGKPVAVSLTLSPILDAEGRIIGISYTARDISDRQRVEKALRESEGRLRAIMDNSQAIIFLKDLRGRYLHINRQFTELFHLPEEKVIGKTDEAIFPLRQAAAFRANDRKTLEAGCPMVFNETARHKDGVHTSIVAKFPLFDLHGKIYALGGIVTDVTERKRLEEEIVRISEHEQQRIAQDLHDGLGQQLAGAWFLSDTLRKTLAAQSSPASPEASKIVSLLETAVSQIRGLARGLSPVPAQPDGLMGALGGLATQCSELFGVNCRFVCHRPVLVNNNKVATNLYRIAQEAINNAVKHGRAREIEIGLFATEGRPALRIVDDGIGFKGVPKEHKGMGLRTMNYRADLIGADFAIRRRKLRGTEVTCHLRA